jgi:hypothetical protein
LESAQIDALQADLGFDYIIDDSRPGLLERAWLRVRAACVPLGVMSHFLLRQHQIKNDSPEN